MDNSSKKASKDGRQKKSNKGKNTYSRYGKNTTRGLRLKEEKMNRSIPKDKEKDVK